MRVVVIDDEDEFVARGKKGHRSVLLVGFPAIRPQITAKEANLEGKGEPVVRKGAMVAY